MSSGLWDEDYGDEVWGEVMGCCDSGCGLMPVNRVFVFYVDFVSELARPLH